MTAGMPREWSELLKARRATYLLKRFKEELLEAKDKDIKEKI